MRRNSLFYVLIFLFVLPSCFSPPHEYWKIDKPRILAVKAYKPEVVTGGTFLEALAFSSEGPVLPQNIYWVAFSLKNVSLYSMGKEKVRPAGTILPPVGNFVFYTPPVTPGEYWVAVKLKENNTTLFLKSVKRVTEVTNSNPSIKDLVINPSPLVSDEIKKVTLNVVPYDPDGDTVYYSWFVVNGSLTGCTKSSEEWDVSGLTGYNQVFVVARDRRGGIDWRMGEIYRGKIEGVWVESGGMLYPLPGSVSVYSSPFTYSVTIVKTDDERGFRINFLQPATGSTTTLDRWYLGFTSCNPCNMVFRVVK